MKYKGYDIVSADSSGGKAGRGKNKTSTLQVRDTYGSGKGYLLLKQIRFNIDDPVGGTKAMEKAKAYVDQQIRS